MDSSLQQDNRDKNAEPPIVSGLSTTASVSPDKTRIQTGLPATGSAESHLQTRAVVPPASPEDAIQPGMVLDGYLLIEAIGRGGMGIVFKARQPQTEQIVALKMIRDGDMVDEESLTRFDREIRALGQLQPVKNIVPIYHVGHHGDLPFFVMPYLGGGSVRSKLKHFLSNRRQAIALVEKIARAVHELHKAGMLHRDIKPGNILLDASDEPFLSDFGLIKRLDLDESLTESHARLGTVPYMAPEQTRLTRHTIGACTDIWSLGVLLYELLTGSRPFGSTSDQDSTSLVWSILHDEPLAPRQKTPDLDAGLEAVVLKCLEKQPDDRFTSAAELADELQRWLNNKPVHTAANRGWRRLARTVGRHRKLLIALALLLLVAGTVTAVVAHLNHPDRPLEPLQQQLAQGQPITLIGEKSRPEWLRWRNGEPGLTSTDYEGYFTVHAPGHVLIELLPEVPCSSYRLRCKIRHDTCEYGGGVGLYVGHYAKSAEFGSYAFYHQVFYDDVIDVNTLAHPQPRTRIDPNCAQFNAVLYADVKGKKPSHFDFCLYGVAHFKASPRRPERVWRELMITVQPHQILAQFDQHPVFSADMNKEITVSRRHLENLATKVKPDVYAPLRFCDTYFPSQGSLGIVLAHGSAAFSNFVLEPLSVEGAK